jgi:hypothetical protein
VAVLLAGLASIWNPAWATQAVSVKDWLFQDNGSSGAEAWTVNDSGSQIGVVCFGKSNCIAYFVSDSGTCQDDSKYPALLNSASGALALTTVCKKIESQTGKPRFVLVINEFNAVLDSILKDHNLGIVIPMASGMFKVARFSLEGSNEALAAVNRSTAAESKPVSRTGDQEL